MKKYILPCIVSGLLMTTAYAEEVASKPAETTPQQEAPQKKETSQQELRAPFCAMTPEDREKTGITKLTAKEQDALVNWWNLRKSIPSHAISQEFTISEIKENGKSIVLSDGSRISFASSERKKTSKWAVGDAVGTMASGRKGSLTLYHMASGQKVKGKRDQAPKNSK